MEKSLTNLYYPWSIESLSICLDLPPTKPPSLRYSMHMRRKSGSDDPGKWGRAWRQFGRSWARAISDRGQSDSTWYEGGFGKCRVLWRCGVHVVVVVVIQSRGRGGCCRQRTIVLTRPKSPPTFDKQYPFHWRILFPVALQNMSTTSPT